MRRGRYVKGKKVGKGNIANVVRFQPCQCCQYAQSYSMCLTLGKVVSAA